jgi:hypothetical protein
VNNPNVAPWSRRVLVATLVAAIAACGNDTKGTEGTSVAIGVVKGIKDKIFSRGKSGPAATPDPEAMAMEAKEVFAGPIILAQIENMGLLSALGEYGRNGDTRTFATSNQQTLSFTKGLLSATRGLGNDLMSADTDAVAALITRRQAGQAAHTPRYLDGEGIERPLPMQCMVTPGSAKSFTIAGTSYDTVQVDETCKVSGTNVTNNYWVTADGTIALSRQWIGPALGYVTVQLVRN